MPLAYSIVPTPSKGGVQTRVTESLSPIETALQTMDAELTDPDAFPRWHGRFIDDTLNAAMQAFGAPHRWLQCGYCGELRHWITDDAWQVRLGAEFSDEPLAWPDGTPVAQGQLARCIWCGEGNLSMSIIRPTPPTSDANRQPGQQMAYGVYQ